MADVPAVQAEDYPTGSRRLSKQDSINRSRKAIRVLAEASQLLRSQGELLESISADDPSLPTPEVQRDAVQRFLSRRLSLKVVQRYPSTVIAGMQSEAPEARQAATCGGGAGTTNAAVIAATVPADVTARGKGYHGAESMTNNELQPAPYTAPVIATAAGDAATSDLADRASLYFAPTEDSNDTDSILLNLPTHLAM